MDTRTAPTSTTAASPMFSSRFTKGLTMAMVMEASFWLSASEAFTSSNRSRSHAVLDRARTTLAPAMFS